MLDVVDIIGVVRSAALGSKGIPLAGWIHFAPQTLSMSGVDCGIFVGSHKSEELYTTQGQSLKLEAIDVVGGRTAGKTRQELYSGKAMNVLNARYGTEIIFLKKIR